MKPAWSVIFLTTLVGTGQGLFLAAFIVDLLRAGAATTLVFSSCSVTFLLLASYFVLGGPERAWRVAAQWRSAWLSREVIVLPAFMGMVLMYGAIHFPDGGRPWALAAGLAASILCVALFVCTGMIHARPKTVSRWHRMLTPVNFLLLGIASGVTLSVPVAVLALPQFAGVLSLAAFSIGAIAYLVRCATLTRDVRPRTARWTFLILAFPVPGLLLGWGGGSLPICVAAFAIQFAGLLAERLLFLPASGSVID
jgi:DMSO reductase anchor subunit